MNIQLISCALFFIAGAVFGQSGKIERELAEDAVRVAYEQGQYDLILEAIR